jgi:hypothetical protein
MYDIEDNVKLSGVGTLARARYHAKNVGKFVRAGCSVAPAKQKYRQPAKRNYGKQTFY